MRLIDVLIIDNYSVKSCNLSYDGLQALRSKFKVLFQAAVKDKINDQLMT